MLINNSQPLCQIAPVKSFADLLHHGLVGFVSKTVANPSVQIVVAQVQYAEADLGRVPGDLRGNSRPSQRQPRLAYPAPAVRRNRPAAASSAHTSKPASSSSRPENSTTPRSGSSSRAGPPDTRGSTDDLVTWSLARPRAKTNAAGPGANAPETAPAAAPSPAVVALPPRAGRVPDGCWLAVRSSSRPLRTGRRRWRGCARGR